MDKLTRYKLEIKREDNTIMMSYVRWEAREAQRKADQDNFEKKFITVVNAVIDAGGVFCIGKSHLDSPYALFKEGIFIRLPSDKEDVIRSHKFVERITAYAS